MSARSFLSFKNNTVKTPAPNPERPATVKYLSTAGFAWRIGSSWVWSCRCCSGDAPSWTMKKPRHKGERNKHRRQRERHRQNGEGDFAGTVHGGAINGFTGFGAADDVFQKDNRVIDQKADGERERHEREVINGITEHQHCHESDQK